MINELKPYPAYQRSAVPWVGEVPVHWSVQRLKTVLREVDRRSGTGVEPLLSLRMQRGLVDHLDVGGRPIPADNLRHYKVTRPGEIVMNRMRAAAGLFGVTPKLGLVSPDYALLLRRQPLDPNFLIRLFQTPTMMDVFRTESRGLGTGESGFLRLYIERFGTLAVALPPVNEQHAIVKFVDHVDRKIRLHIRAKQKLLKLLQEEKNAIIDQAVTRGLDPVSRPRGEHAVDLVHSETRRITTNQQSIPWLQSIPDRWGISSSKRLFSVRNELARPGDEQLSATQAYGVIPQSEFERRVGRRVVKISLHLDKRRHVEVDDFVISMRSFQGGLERAWTAGCIRSSYIVLKPSSANVDVKFFMYLFKSPAYIQALQATSNFIRDGQDLNFRNFCLVDLPVVPIPEQRAIASYLDGATAGISSAMNASRREVSLLAELRTRLIADVVTGKLDVRDAAARLPDQPGHGDEADEVVDAEAGDGNETPDGNLPDEEDAE